MPYTVVVTRTRRVPYRATEWYTAYEPRTRQVAYTVRVPYTVEVPVYATQVRRVAYQAQETYLDDSACSRHPTRRFTQQDPTGATAYGPGEAAVTGAPLRLAQPWWLQVGQVAVGVHEVAFRKVEFVNKSFEPHATPSGRLTSALSAKLALIRLPGQFLWPDGSRGDIASQAAQGVVDAYEGWSLVHRAVWNNSKLGVFGRTIGTLALDMPKAVWYGARNIVNVGALPKVLNAATLADAWEHANFFGRTLPILGAVLSLPLVVQGALVVAWAGRQPGDGYDRAVRRASGVLKVLSGLAGIVGAVAALAAAGGAAAAAAPVLAGAAVFGALTYAAGAWLGTESGHRVAAGILRKGVPRIVGAVGEARRRIHAAARSAARWGLARVRSGVHALVKAQVAWWRMLGRGVQGLRRGAATLLNGMRASAARAVDWARSAAGAAVRQARHLLNGAAAAARWGMARVRSGVHALVKAQVAWWRMLGRGVQGLRRGAATLLTRMRATAARAVRWARSAAARQAQHLLNGAPAVAARWGMARVRSRIHALVKAEAARWRTLGRGVQGLRRGAATLLNGVRSIGARMMNWTRRVAVAVMQPAARTARRIGNAAGAAARPVARLVGRAGSAARNVLSWRPPWSAPRPAFSGRRR